MSKVKVLVTCDLTSEALAVLRSRDDIDLQFSQTPQPTPAELEKVQVLLTRSGTRVNDQLLQNAPALKFVVTATSGFDHFDLKLLQKNGVGASFCPSANAESAAQWTLTLMLNLLRQFSKMAASVRQQKWREGFTRGVELSGLQLGIVGLGRIGSRVATLAQAMQMDVVTYDPYVPRETFSRLNVKTLGLIELFKTSDVISFHVPLTIETKAIVNRRTLEHINPDAYLINVSRGAVIHEAELATHMRLGHLKGAALDVFENEPLPKDSPLRGLSNVILVPHVGAYTDQAFARGSFEAAEKVVAFLRGQPVSDSLPPQTEWANHLIQTP
jgi:D-3-phosphoglycerate dehydrogenase